MGIVSLSRIKNHFFDSRYGYSRGKSALVFALWQLVKWFFFKTVFPWPTGLKVVLLKLFGASVGEGVIIKPQVNIHLPWKLAIGDHAWIGEEVFLLNFEPMVIGAHACISQRAFLCGGNHDFRDPAMKYRNGPITICDGAWVGAQVFVAPGVIVGIDAVIAAGSVLLSNADAGLIYKGNPALVAGMRWKD